MDFALNATAAAVAEVADEVFGRLETDWSDKFVDAPGFDAAAWTALGDSGVLALALPGSHGGDDVDIDGMLPLLRRMGRSAAVTPALGTIAAQLVLQRADAGVAEHWQRTLVDGWGSIALTSSTSLTDGKLTGSASGLLHAEGAAVILASFGDSVVAVDPTASGVSLARTFTSSGWSEYTATFDGADAVALDVAADVLRDLYQIVLGGYADGLVAGATRLTADHVSQRNQFGKPIALFQAVGQQLADIYVIGRSMELATTAGAWRLSQRLPARVDVAIGAYWLAAEIPATLRTMTHLHGGVGVDITYPLHRYYSIAKDLARLVGGSVATLDALADAFAAARSANLESANHPGGSETSQFIDLTDDQRALKAQVREYFADLISPEDAEEMLVTRHGETYRKVIAQMGRDGWLGVGWPKEFGGKGFGDIEQQIFTNEAVRADVPLPSVTLQTVGPTLQVHGSEEQKQKFLPDILAGQVHFAIGYTEPEAGTDLASLTTTAVLDGDHYVVNGQKIFTTGGHDADYIWLAVRTDKNAPKHKGISILIVDTTDPGFSWTPIITADGAHHVNATYYNDVKVPVGMRVGEEGDGWKLITTQLNHERVMLGPAGRVEGIARRVEEWASGPGPDGSPIAEHPDVRRVFAQIEAYGRINELLNWQVASTGEAISMADAAATKVFATERIQVIGRLIDEIVGRFGDYTDPKTAELARWLDAQQKRNVVITFGGGVNEVMRDMIATAGLGLPRAKRQG